MCGNAGKGTLICYRENPPAVWCVCMATQGKVDRELQLYVSKVYTYGLTYVLSGEMHYVPVPLFPSVYVYVQLVSHLFDTLMLNMKYDLQINLFHLQNTSFPLITLS